MLGRVMPRDPFAGRLVGGRYRLVRRIGAGGMGVVWQARDERLDVDVAVKELHVSLADRPLADPPVAGRAVDGRAAADSGAAAVDVAVREARHAARLRGCPHVVTVHDVVADGGRPWIVMDLVVARSLLTAVREDGPLPAPEAARLGLVVLDGLVYGHDRGVLHCDVKPSNILLTPDGRVLLTDFGVASHRADPTVTPHNSIGTPAYLAPERMVGGPATFASDLFSLGATLYYAVAGTGAFQRAGVPETIDAVLRSEPTPPPQAGQLWPAISGLLAKNLAGRLGADGARALLRWACAAPGPRPRPAADVAASRSTPTRPPPPGFAPLSLVSEPAPQPAPVPTEPAAARHDQAGTAPAPTPAPAAVGPNPAAVGPAAVGPTPPPATPSRARRPDPTSAEPATHAGLRRARARARARSAWGTPPRPGVPDLPATDPGADGAGSDAVPVRLASTRGRAVHPAAGPPGPVEPADPAGRARAGRRRAYPAVAGALAATAVAVAVLLGVIWAGSGGGDRPAAVGAVPGGFLGHWHGTVVFGEREVETSVVVRGGGVGAAVGEVVTDADSAAVRCTAGLVLVSVDDPVLTVRVLAADATRCGLAHAARLTLHDDRTLGFYVEATHRSRAGAGRLARS
jgi:serine/threonine protein kinase